MARIKIDLPDDFNFSTTIPLRITDLNYGGHVGNDTVLSIVHEARIQFLRSFQYKELDFAGVSLIMSDAALEFKAELFYGDSVIASVAADEFSNIGFDLYYKLEKVVEGKRVIVALAKTGMICFDYDLRKVVRLPFGVQDKMLRAVNSLS
ncbi:MAG: thioesterase family protein [Chitinophagaceae bacterium]|nr:thioesterase family protein [Chitinophagaceae bacterium]